MSWSRLKRSIVVLGLAVGLLLATALPAGAAVPELTITGEPTEEESREITEQWDRFLASFGGFASCMGPIEVRVVDRAEDYFGTSNVGSIAAFYTFPPDAFITIEHRKVVPRHLIHEFSHHLDVSCEVGAGPSGTAFRAAHGISEDAGWFSGRTWAGVPAEIFAEAVVTFFEEPTRIDVGEPAVAVVRSLTHVPAPEVRATQERQVRAAVAGILRSDDRPRDLRVPFGGVFAV